MTNPDASLPIAPGTDITVDPEDIDAEIQDDPGAADPESTTDDTAMGGTGGGNAGGAG